MISRGVSGCLNVLLSFYFCGVCGFGMLLEAFTGVFDLVPLLRDLARVLLLPREFEGSPADS